jgi:hypothetical protein
MNSDTKRLGNTEVGLTMLGDIGECLELCGGGCESRERQLEILGPSSSDAIKIGTTCLQLTRGPFAPETALSCYSGGALEVFNGLFDLGGTIQVGVQACKRTEQAGAPS